MERAKKSGVIRAAMDRAGMQALDVAP